MTAGKANGAAEHSRLLMICVDAMSLDFARAHLDRLPVLQGLIKEGRLTELQSAASQASACVWPSFAAGEHPGVHGHYYPFQWDAAAMKFRRTSAPEWSTQLEFEPFWRRIARNGAPAIAFDAGITVDPANSPCLEIANWSYQSSGEASCSDPALLKEIRPRFGRRPIGKEVPVPKTLRRSRRIRDSLIAAVARKTDAALWLAEKRQWRLFLLGYYEIHRAGHNLMVVNDDFGSEADPDALLAVYTAFDDQLGRLLRQLKDERTTVLLFALHGMAENNAQDHLLDAILARLNEAWRVLQGERRRPVKGSNLVSRLRGQVPYDIQYSLAHLLGEHVQDWVVNRTMTGGVDWSQTPSFRMASGGEGYIRFNLMGRERDGRLSDDEAVRYKDWLIERLREIRIAESDQPLITEVNAANALFPGERSRFLPDLILTFANVPPARSIRSPVIGKIEAHLDTGRGGNHTGDAFLIASGPGARSANLGAVRDIMDLGRFAEALLLAEASLKDATEPAREDVYADA